MTLNRAALSPPSTLPGAGESINSPWQRTRYAREHESIEVKQVSGAFLCHFSPSLSTA